MGFGNCFFPDLPENNTSVPQIYKFYLDLGKLALDQKDYDEALVNFQRAQMVAPTEKEPTVLINLIKRLQDDRIEPKPAKQIFRPFKKTRAKIIEKSGGINSWILVAKTILEGNNPAPTIPKLAKTINCFRRFRNFFRQIFSDSRLLLFLSSDRGMF